MEHLNGYVMKGKKHVIWKLIQTFMVLGKYLNHRICVSLILSNVLNLTSALKQSYKYKKVESALYMVFLVLYDDDIYKS